jgi:hypothetical protein
MLYHFINTRNEKSRSRAVLRGMHCRTGTNAERALCVRNRNKKDINNPSWFLDVVSKSKCHCGTLGFESQAV